MYLRKNIKYEHITIFKGFGFLLPKRIVLALKRTILLLVGGNQSPIIQGEHCVLSLVRFKVWSGLGIG